MTLIMTQASTGYRCHAVAKPRGLDWEGMGERGTAGRAPR